MAAQERAAGCDRAHGSRARPTREPYFIDADTVIALQDGRLSNGRAVSSAEPERQPGSFAATSRNESRRASHGNRSTVAASWARPWALATRPGGVPGQ